MLKSCKYCGCTNLVKNGFVFGLQRYRCKGCSRNIREGDKRQKFDLEKKLKVIKCYLEGMGIRSISRLEGVSNPLVIQWIRHYSTIVKESLIGKAQQVSKKDIEVLEIDELFSYCQKKLPQSPFGWLLIGTEIKCLTLKSAKKEI
jgi:transposase-like protein